MADAYAMYGSLPLSGATSRQHSFYHLAFPDYGCLYYCYLFSQVLATDLFTKFAESGNLLGKEIWDSYRRIVLEKGSSRDAKEMVAEFLGRDFNLKAYRHWVSEGKRSIEKTERLNEAR
jgi:Zn-dependent oligopeptidase